QQGRPPRLRDQDGPGPRRTRDARDHRGERSGRQPVTRRTPPVASETSEGEPNGSPSPFCQRRQRVMPFCWKPASRPPVIQTVSVAPPADHFSVSLELTPGTICCGPSLCGCEPTSAITSASLILGTPALMLASSLLIVARVRPLPLPVPLPSLSLSLSLSLPG